MRLEDLQRIQQSRRIIKRVLLSAAWPDGPARDIRIGRDGSSGNSWVGNKRPAGDWVTRCEVGPARNTLTTKLDGRNEDLLNEEDVGWRLGGVPIDGQQSGKRSLETKNIQELAAACADGDLALGGGGDRGDGAINRSTVQFEQISDLSEGKPGDERGLAALGRLKEQVVRLL